MLAVDLLWIVIGIVYIIYKGLREETETTVSILKGLALVFLPIALLLFFVGDDPPEWAGVIVLIMWIIEGIIIVKVSDRKNGFFSKKKEKKIAQYTEMRLQDLMTEFSNAGYKVSEVIWSDCSGLQKTVEAIKREKYIVPLYNRRKDRPSTIHEIYEGLSTLQYMSLTGHSIEKLCGLIGCDVKSVPMNENITQEDVRSSRVREQYELAKIRGKSIPTKQALDYALHGFMIWSIEEEKEMERQCAALLVSFILNKFGLHYPKKRLDELPKDQDYIQRMETFLSMYKEAKLNV